MFSRLRSAILAVGLLILTAGAATAFPAQVGPNSNLRWGPGMEFPVQIVVPAGSIVDVENCDDRWCFVRWEEYEGFIHHSLLIFPPSIVVPYVTVYPDYEYYYGFIYGPTFVFRYYGDFHSRAVSRADLHSRTESRRLTHSRSASRASHSRADSRRTLHEPKVVPEAIRRQREQIKRQLDRAPAAPRAAPTPRALPKAAPAPRVEPRAPAAPRIQPRTAPAPKVQPRVTPTPRVEPRATPAPKVQPRAAPAPRVQPKAAPAPKLQPRVAPSPRQQPRAAPAPKQPKEAPPSTKKGDDDRRR